MPKSENAATIHRFSKKQKLRMTALCDGSDAAQPPSFIRDPALSARDRQTNSAGRRPGNKSEKTFSSHTGLFLFLVFFFYSLLLYTKTPERQSLHPGSGCQSIFFLLVFSGMTLSRHLSMSSDAQKSMRVLGLGTIRRIRYRPERR